MRGTSSIYHRLYLLEGVGVAEGGGLVDEGDV